MGCRVLGESVGALEKPFGLKELNFFYKGPRVYIVLGTRFGALWPQGFGEP